MSDKNKSDAPETPKKEGMSQDVKDAIALATAMVAETLKGHAGAAPTGRRAAINEGPRCSECGQYEVCCGKKHRKVVVWPSDPHFARFFQGYRLNGVTYLSNGPAHAITVPAEANIEYAVEMWTRNERETSQGRVAEHNSGSVHQFNPAIQGWR